MAEGFEVGQAFIRIRPDTGDFAEELKSKVEEAAAGAEAQVPIGADDADLQAVLDDAKAKLDELDGSEGRVTLTADDEELSEKVDDAAAKVGDLDGATAEPVILLDTGEFDQGAEAATEQLSQLDGETAAPTLELETGGFDEGAEAVTEQLAQLDGKTATPSAHLSDADAKAKIDELKAQLAMLKAKRAGITVTADATPAEMQIAELEAQIAALQNQGRSLNLGEGKGSMMGGLTMGLAALSPGFAGAASGLGLLGGTGALAFGGIAQALGAAHQATNTLGMTSQQVAAQHFSNSVQITQAQQSVTQAKEQAAQNQVTSSQQIQQADMSLAMTARNTAAQQVQALQSVQEAQQQVQQATYNLGEANYNLGQAYVQARQDIINLNDQLANSKLSVQSASLAVQQAEYQERLVNQNAYSTSIDRAQASLAVAQAKQQLKDATDQEAQAQYSANLANKQGVNGSQTVIQAKQAQLSAQNGLTDAQNSYADAQRNLVNTQLNSQDQLKQAQMQLSAAQEQAAYQQKMDAQAVSVAEQNLTNTIKGQQLQWAAMMSTQNQALRQFQMYMARLTPAGRGFVNQILGMRGAFRQLEHDAQNATLPGFTVALKGVAHLVPVIESGVTKMGRAISNAFAGFGKELQTPAAAKVLTGLISNGVQFANIVLPAFGKFFGELAKIGSQKGAVSGLANLLAGIARGLTGIARTVGQYQGPINQFLTAVGNIVAQIGPALGTIIGWTAKAFGLLTSYLDKHPNGTVAKVIGGIAASLIAFKTLHGPVSTLIGLPGKIRSAWGTITGIPGKITSTWNSLAGFPGKVAGAWGKVFGEGGQLSGMIGGLKNMVSGLPGTMSSVVEAIKGWGIWSRVASAATKVWAGIQAGFNMIMDANPIALVALALIGIGVAIYEAYKHFKWFRDGVREVFGWLKSAALYLWHDVLDPAWHGIERGVSWLYDNGIKQYFGLIRDEFRLLQGAALWLWHNVLDPVWHGIEQGVAFFVGHFRSSWNSLENIFKVPVNFLIQTVYDHGIARLWNDVTGAVGLGSLKLPVIAALAGGGVIPGYAPGHDSVPAMLSPGESVLTPGATRAVGAPVIHALNAAYAPSGGSRAPGHFSFGGFVSGLAHDVVNAGKIGLAVLTGNTTEFVNAASQVIGTPAAGMLGQVMMAMPKSLVGDMARALSSALNSSAAAGGSAAGGSMTSWMEQAVKLAGVPAAWIPDLETIAMHESSDSPTAVNGWDSNAAAGNASRGLMQVVPTTFAMYHVPGTSMNIFNPVANIAAAARYIQARYGTIGAVPGIVSLAHGGNYVGYDSGGMLPPGMTAAVNQTGRPEAVLTNEQMSWLRQAADRGAGEPRQVVHQTVQFVGTQVPSHEQMAEIERRLSLAVSGG